MMRLSTKGRYGTRIMTYLADHYGQGFILLKDIAKSEDISEGYLEQLIPLLKAGGLLLSIRGAKGGYMLAKDPSEITVKDVLQTMEGSLAPVACVDNPTICNRVDDCSTYGLWSELKANVVATLEAKTLADLVQTKKKKRKK